MNQKTEGVGCKDSGKAEWWTKGSKNGVIEDRQMNEWTDICTSSTFTTEKHRHKMLLHSFIWNWKLNSVQPIHSNFAQMQSVAWIFYGVLWISSKAGHPFPQ